jgi:exopolysaccharide/PEP-CTERM locus tyrosine autokinase
MVVVDRQLLRDSGLLAPENLEKHMADQYRLIKRPILENVARAEVGADDSPMNLIMVASALSGDGKTFTCINLALSIATEQDTSVLLVDADVAKPHISTLFGIEQEKGLIDLLTTKELETRSAIIATDVPGLSVLPAGKTHPRATELLASKRMEKIVAELSAMQASRVVIFDSPPILATSESRVLATQMGQIVMIVCAGHTPQHAVTEALASLDETKAINMVLNQATDGFGTDGYGWYGYGYSRGTTDTENMAGSQL